MRYAHSIDIEIVRNKPDSLGLSAESMDRLRLELFTEALREALLGAVAKGILPRKVRVSGLIKIEGEVHSETDGSMS